MKKLIMIMLLALAACSQNTDQYDTTSKAKWDHTKVEIHWTNKDEVSDTCKSFGTDTNGGGDYNGCAFSKPNTTDTCEIYVVQPSKFDDQAALQVLGHELWHCLGATHK